MKQYVSWISPWIGGPLTAYKVKAGITTSIDSLGREEGLWWTSCAILTRCNDEEHSFEAIAGEAGHGSDGFVGTIDLRSGDLIWLAFFLNSNPFDKLIIADRKIHAYSTSGCVWSLSLGNPIDIVVECKHISTYWRES
jgi:hypothetical protein